MTNPIREAAKVGQSVWYDNLRRGMIVSGELGAMVDEGLGGITSNPSTFEKAIGGSIDYDEAIRELVRGCVCDATALFERLAIEDIQNAAAVFNPVFAGTGRQDGYVSMEVSPHVAYDTEATAAEARRLFRALARENVMVKIPGTPEGIAAIPGLIADGINVNVTLLFSLEAHRAAAEAYIAGLEALVEAGGDPSQLASVASFFLSRIDVAIDDRVAQALETATDPGQRAALEGLLGRVATANAKLASAQYEILFSGERWEALARRGARPQRLLWASTGVKNPRYPKLMYVEPLIGPDTINTMPAETYQEFRKHGRVRVSLSEGRADAQYTMETLAACGISMEAVTRGLLVQGVQLFATALDKLLVAVDGKRQAILAELAQEAYTVGPAEPAMRAALDDWRTNGKVRRLWQADGTLWSGDGDGAAGIAADQWMGWLHLVDRHQDQLAPLARLVDDVRAAGFRSVLVLGMGGASLCPWVLERTFGQIPRFPELLVLDSVIPEQIRATERRLDIDQTLFVVSSKSGTTIETQALMRHFMRLVGPGEAHRQFIAITDPGTPLADLAQRARFKHTFLGPPDVGGRYSALSSYGLVPAALMGLDVARLLDRAALMVQACASCCPPEANPGVTLGLVLGTLARQGRDKVTFVASPPLRPLGAWLEQLLAESTGKNGTGLIPVDDERVGTPLVYGDDRLFVYIRDNAPGENQLDRDVAMLERAGHPIVRIALADPIDLGQEFFRWEIATAVAASVLGVNPFDQPDVEIAKKAARDRLQATPPPAQGQDRPLSPKEPIAQSGALALFADETNAEVLRARAGRATPEAMLRAHLGRLRSGDYFALQAFVPSSDEDHVQLQAIRHAVRDGKRVATTLGYGPRFLHSTGQLHKGGPPSGLFLQITGEHADDLPIPDERYTFGMLARAEADGDFAVLANRGRRLLRVDVGPDVATGLARLRELIDGALAPTRRGEHEPEVRA